MKIRLSSRDTDPVETQYDPKNFEAEYNVTPSKNFSVSNMAMVMWDLGYHDMEGITKQLKDRNYEVDAKAKEIIKAVIEKMVTQPEDK